MTGRRPRADLHHGQERPSTHSTPAQCGLLPDRPARGPVCTRGIGQDSRAARVRPELVVEIASDGSSSVSATRPGEPQDRPGRVAEADTGATVREIAATEGL
ncbi:hypothetical protein [Kitasatospora sp. NPDC087314]|uniref:hypothetical protein n=1 Tax=Kitasatospora sp. NPDC087314 TaxID=3364068 RepID=UPI00381A4B7D